MIKLLTTGPFADDRRRRRHRPAIANKRGAMALARSRLADLVNGILRHADLELRRIVTEIEPAVTGLHNVEPWVTDIIQKVRPFTMTSDERIAALCHAVRYVVRSNIPGDIVECGVWRGGSMMAAALTLLAEGDSSRTLHLFDTFDGMPPPTSADRAAGSGKLASVLLHEADKSSNIWAYAHIDEVWANLASTDYPAANIRLIRGKVEDTIPATAPLEIAILRLDTDWYESTRHELVYLFPRLSIGGALIIDDYGYWEGARKAVDEYIEENQISVLLNRIDDTGRIAVKTAAP
jgi:O-methyltransferase